MSHQHSVRDTDTRFIINPITRAIRNETSRKTVLIQGDHNSERFTFELPRYVENHDMSLCNVVEVHYLNIDPKTKLQHAGFYTVDDLHVDGDQVVCSWLVSENATSIAGHLIFLVKYKCVENDIITYQWNTDRYSAISVSEGIDASDSFELEYVDIIEQWKESVVAGFADDIVVEVNKATKTLEARMDTFTSLPNGSTVGDAELMDIRVGADGVTYSNAGDAVRGQITNTENKFFDELTCICNGENTIIPELVYGFVRYANGEVSNVNIDEYYKRTDYIRIPMACEQIKHNFLLSAGGSEGIVFFDSAKNFISGVKESEVITEIPNNAKFVMFTSYDNTFSHEGKFVTFIAETDKFKTNIKTLVTFGDSHVARGLWQPQVIEHFEIENHVNLGIGSSTVAINNKATQLPFISDERLNAIQNENPDTIIIIGGTNDVHLETPLGNIEELREDIENKNKTTFYGAYGYLIETLLTWKPTLQIILCTTPQGHYDTIHPLSYAEISQAIKNIGFHYSLPIADIFGKCGINKNNLTTYSDDLIHYNELGNARIASIIINTITESYLHG